MDTAVMLYSLATLSLFTLGVGQSTRSTHEVNSICGDGFVLRCMATSQHGVQYRSVRWYKVSEEPPHQVTGLLLKRLDPQNNTIQRYSGLLREVELLPSLDLYLPNVTAQDSGRYSCLLAAPVGQQNQEGEVFLRVHGCPELKDRDNLILLLAIVLLTVGLLIFTISYVSIKNILMRSLNKKLQTDPFLKTQCQKKDLIYTLGPKGSGSMPFHQVCV